MHHSSESRIRRASRSVVDTLGRPSAHPQQVEHDLEPSSKSARRRRQRAYRDGSEMVGIEIAVVHVHSRYGLSDEAAITCLSVGPGEQSCARWPQDYR